MNILSAIMSSIWDTITFMDKEQRALVAHVLTVSQAHPKSFKPKGGGVDVTWEASDLGISVNPSRKAMIVDGLGYPLGWRASAILARHFNMLHLCKHHEHIGRALSDIDRVENTPAESEPKKDSTCEKQQPPVDYDFESIRGRMVDLANRSDINTSTGVSYKGAELSLEPIDLAKYVGRNCYVEMSNGDKGNCYVNYLQTEDAVLLLDSDLLFNRYGKHVYGYDLYVTLIRELEGSFRDCIKTDDLIKPVDNFGLLDLSGWTTDIDLTQWIGRTVDVKLRNDTIVDAVEVSHRAGKALYQVKVEHMSYTRWGKCWHDRLDGQDIMAIRLST